MKILLKIVLTLVGLALLAGLAMLLAMLVVVPGLTTLTTNLHRMAPWLDQVLAAVVLFFAAATVLGIVMVVSMPSRRHLYTVNREMGRIEISRQSIISAADASLAGVAGLNRFSAEIKGQPSPHRLVLEVHAEPKPGQNLYELGSRAQEKVQADLAASLNIEPKSVKVKLLEVHRGATESQAEKVPRVV